MPFNGNGIFARVYSWANDAASGLAISSSRMDAEDSGFAAGLSNCVTRDGQSPPVANLPMGGFKLSGLADGAGAGEAATYNQLSALQATVSPLATRTAMAALALTAGAPVYLSEAGREGWFRLTAGTAPTDPLQGLYVPSAVSGYYWSRIWNGTIGELEWFGATVNDSSFDNVPIFNAAFALVPHIKLRAADYFIRQTLVMSKERTRLTGYCGADYGADGQQTRIVLTGNAARTDPILTLGNTTLSLTDLKYQIVCEDFEVIRDSTPFPPTPPASGLIRDAVKGIIAQNLLKGRIRNVPSNESPVGYYVAGCVNTDFTDCQDTRTSPGSSATNDVRCGWLIGGAFIMTGYVGSNASLRLTRCSSFGTNAQHVNSHGMLLESVWTDTFIRDFESAGQLVGIELSGASYSNYVAQRDIFIDRPTCDAHTHCILVNNTNSSAMINVTDPYLAPVAGGDGFSATSASGITITGGQIICYSPNENGLAMTSCSGFYVNGLRINDALVPVKISGCNAYSIQPIVVNNRSASGVDQGVVAAIVIVNSARGIIAPVITGANAYTTCITLDSASQLHTINLGAINWGACSTPGVTHIVAYNGADASTGSGATAAASAHVKFVGDFA